MLVSSVTKAPSADAQDVPQYSWTRPLDSVKRGFALHLMHKEGAGAGEKRFGLRSCFWPSLDEEGGTWSALDDEEGGTWSALGFPRLVSEEELSLLLPRLGPSLAEVLADCFASRISDRERS